MYIRVLVDKSVTPCFVEFPAVCVFCNILLNFLSCFWKAIVLNPLLDFVLLFDGETDFRWASTLGDSVTENVRL